ncbi:ABC transporter substrate-binding protein [Streptosporangium sp. NPDC002607]
MLTRFSPRSGERHEGRSSSVRARLAGVLLLALTASTACGDGGSGGSDTPGITDTEVKVAIVVPKTGPSAPTFDGFEQGIRARFEEANAAGGVHGRKIKLVTLDDAGDGAQQVVAGRNAVQSEKAFGIIAASRVDTMYAYLKQNNVPVTGFPGQPPFANDRNAFGAYGSFAMGLAQTATAQTVKDRGVTKMAVFAHNSPGAINSADAFVFASKQVGLPVVMKQYDIPLGSFDATAIAVRLKELGVDGVYLPMLTQSNVSIMQAVKQQGIELKAGYVTYDPSAIAQAGKALEGALGTPSGTIPLELDQEPVRKYRELMAKYAPKVDPAGNLFTAVGWISADLFLHGLDLAGASPTRQAFIDNLRKEEAYTGRGLLVQPVSFKPGILPNGDPVKCVWLETIKDGKYVPDADKICGELVKVQ